MGDDLAPAGGPRWVTLEGGSFIAGSDDFYPDEAPARERTVAAFQLATTPVTNRQFATFVEATGHLTVAERPLSEAARAPSMGRMGVLFQGGALFDSLKVWENVAFRSLRGAGRKTLAAAKAAAIEKLRRVGLTPEAAERYPAELSGGMQKRAALARAVMADPQLLFIDEPTAGLDPIMSGVINSLIRELVTESGATAVTITHDLRTLQTVADRVAMLHQGRIVWSGPVGAVADDPNPYLRQFISGAAEGPIEAVR